MSSSPTRPAGTLAASLLAGPLELTVTFYLARPRGHYGTGRNADRLRPSAPAHPTTRPDTSKLVRALEDALTRQVYADDAQIVRQHAERRYGVPERTEVTIRQLPPKEAPL